MNDNACKVGYSNSIHVVLVVVIRKGANVGYILTTGLLVFPCLVNMEIGIES